MKTPDRKQIEGFVNLNRDCGLLDIIQKLTFLPIGKRYDKLPLLIEAWAEFGLHKGLAKIFDETKWELPWPKVAKEGELPSFKEVTMRYPKRPHAHFWETIFDVFDLEPDSDKTLLAK